MGIVVVASLCRGARASSYVKTYGCDDLQWYMDHVEGVLVMIFGMARAFVMTASIA